MSYLPASSFRDSVRQLRGDEAREVLPLVNELRDSDLVLLGVVMDVMMTR